jgi:hypothetical protein
MGKRQNILIVILEIHESYIIHKTLAPVTRISFTNQKMTISQTAELVNCLFNRVFEIINYSSMLRQHDNVVGSWNNYSNLQFCR